MTFSKTIKKSAGSFPIRLQNQGFFRNFVTTKWIQGKTAKIGCGLFGVSKIFYNLNTLTYWRLRYGFSYRSLRQEDEDVANEQHPHFFSCTSNCLIVCPFSVLSR